MGQELECKMRLRSRSLAGKAYLETDYLLFRGDERIKLAFSDLKSVTAADGVLRLDFEDGPAELELGKAAVKWADKILHPPTRAAKLGLEPGTTVKLIGDFPRDFHDELAAAGAETVARNPQIVFYSVDTAAALKKLPSAPTLWIVYPKGVKTIREVDVINAGRDIGLKDVKVARFSDTHTALKFVRPR